MSNKHKYKDIQLAIDDFWSLWTVFSRPPSGTPCIKVPRKVARSYTAEWTYKAQPTMETASDFLYLFGQTIWFQHTYLKGVKLFAYHTYYNPPVDPIHRINLIFIDSIQQTRKWNDGAVNYAGNVIDLELTTI